MHILKKVDDLIEESIIPGKTFLRDIIRGALFAIGAFLVGAFLYVAKSIIKITIRFISDSIFQFRVKNKIKKHLLNLDEFIDFCKENNIKRSGIVRFEDISKETFSCIKNRDRLKAIECVVVIIKTLHFYLMDLMIQFVFIIEKDIKFNSIFDLKDITFANHELNQLKELYFILLLDFFKVINEIKKVEKASVIGLYELEQEFNEKFLSIKNFYLKQIII